MLQCVHCEHVKQEATVPDRRKNDLKKVAAGGTNPTSQYLADISNTQISREDAPRSETVSNVTVTNVTAGECQRTNHCIHCISHR
jgi:hypothetical protein